MTQKSGALDLEIFWISILELAQEDEDKTYMRCYGILLYLIHSTDKPIKLFQYHCKAVASNGRLLKDNKVVLFVP